MTSRAVDAWGAIRALTAGKPSVIANIAIAAAYAVAFAALREASNDQWYLPAGLRFAAALATPIRLWPALYLGDMAGLAIARYPVIDRHGWAWYLGMLLPAWPPVAAVIYQLRARTKLPRIQRPLDAAALAVGVVLSAEGASLASKISSALLTPGSDGIRLGDLIVYSMGDIQGILVGGFLVALTSNGWLARERAKIFRAEALCAITVTGGLAGAVATAHLTQAASLDGARLLLFVPAVALSLRHGWRGACVGAIGGDLALLWTIPHQDKGMSDAAALTMQEVFTFLSLALFVLGARGSAPAVPSEQVAEGVSKREARGEHRARFNSIEAALREKALRAEAMQANSRGSIAPVVAILRKSGHSEAAMDLIGATHLESTQFRHTVIDGIYPLTVERDGLYAALHSDGFLERFGTSKCRLDLIGSAHGISLGTLLSAYRMLGDAVDYLLTSDPSHIDISVRCSVRLGRNHLSMALVARNPVVTERTAVDTARLARLRTRACAFDGSFHNRPHRLRIIMVDTESEISRHRGADTGYSLTCVLERSDHD
mgnify:CR=1 FL=1